MRELNFPGVRDDLDACRDMASQARVERTFFITSTEAGTDECLHLTRSLPTAFELWSGAPDRRFTVSFSWSFGDESGAGAVRYGKHDHTALRSHITEKNVQDLIIQDIAHKLFKRLPQVDIV